MFSGIRDSLSSSALKSLLASRISRYGKLTDLRIRSKDRTIRLELQLEGEQTAITIEVESYRIFDDNGTLLLTVERARASRPWLERVIEDFVVGRPFPVPSMALFVLGGSEQIQGTGRT